VHFGNGSSTGWWAVSAWAANTAYSVGQVVRQKTTATAEISIASPAVITWKDAGGSGLTHNFAAGDKVVFTTTGALPTGITSGTSYYVMSTNLQSTSFQIAATPGGSAVNATGTQSGTHTGTGIRSGYERCYVCTTAGTSAATLEPVWTFTRGAIQASDNGVIWQECTGQPPVNGDSTNTIAWATVKQLQPYLGTIIKGTNDYLYICSVSSSNGTSSTEPSWTTTPGNTTVDGGVTWKCLGAISTLNYGAWAAPFARLSASYASTWGAATNTFYVAHTSAEVITLTANQTITCPGIAGSLCYTYSIDATAALPPSASTLSAGATITSIGAGSVSIAGSGYYYGMRYIHDPTGNPTISVTATMAFGVFKDCIFRENSTNSSNCTVALGGNAAAVNNITFDNTQVGLGHVNSYIALNGSNFVWKNTATPLLGTVPTTKLFSPAILGSTILEAVDLSQIASGNSIIGPTTANEPVYYPVLIKNCKITSGAVITGSPTITSSTPRMSSVDVINVDSSGTNYTQQRYRFQGTQTVETTIIRTGGATDGTTPIAWKIVTSAYSSWVSPFECTPSIIWNDTTGGNVTVTVYGIWGGGAVPNNDEIWIEVDYLGSASTPIGTIVTTTKTYPNSTSSATSSDTSTWGGSTTAFKMTTTLSTPQPALTGLLYVTVKAAKASSTFYIDPKVVLG
jgi:hypothetical protein